MQELGSHHSNDEEHTGLHGHDAQVEPDARVVEGEGGGEVGVARDDEGARGRALEEAGLELGRGVGGAAGDNVGGRASEVEVVKFVGEDGLNRASREGQREG